MVFFVTLVFIGELGLFPFPYFTQRLVLKGCYGMERMIDFMGDTKKGSSVPNFVAKGCKRHIVRILVDQT